MLKMVRGFLCNRWSVLLLAGALAPLVLQANAVFTNVTSTADANNGSFVFGGSLSTPCPNPMPPGVIDAEAFTPDADFTLTDAQMLVFAPAGSGGEPNFNVFLYSNASANRVRRSNRSALTSVRPLPIPVRS